VKFNISTVVSGPYSDKAFQRHYWEYASCHMQWCGVLVRIYAKLTRFVCLLELMPRIKTWFLFVQVLL